MIKKLEDIKNSISMSVIDRHRTYANISPAYIKYALSKYYRATAVVNMSKDQVYFKHRERKKLPIYVYAEDLDIREYENERGYYEDYKTMRGVIEACSAKTLRTLSWRCDNFE